MKAAVLHELRKPLRIHDDVEAPPLKPEQLLVRVEYSGVCHSQLMEVTGRRGADRFLPHLLGHEGSGVVVAAGERVTKVRPGDRVVLGWIKGDGLDAGGVQYRSAGQTLNAGSVTTFNDHAVVSENRCVPVPAGLPMDVAALLGCAVLTGAGMVINDVKPVAGSSVAVFGLGGIGLSALMALRLFECATIVGVDVAPDKLRLASEVGATHVIDARSVDAVQRVRDLTGGGADYAIEAAGRCDTIEAAFNAVRRGGGLCVFASHPEQGQRVCLDPFEMICGKQIRGSWGGGSRPDRDIPRLAAEYLGGRLPLDRLIGRRYGLDQINDALNDLEAGGVTRPLIEMHPTVGARQ